MKIKYVGSTQKNKKLIKKLVKKMQPSLERLANE